VPSSLREDRERYRDEKGRVKVPLMLVATLLIALDPDDPVGRALQGPGLRDALSRRHCSISAHGLEPLTPGAVERPREGLEPVLRQGVGNLDRLMEEARFPTLTPGLGRPFRPVLH